MTDIDERIKNAKREALILFLEGEMYREITYAKWEAHYLKSLYEQKEKEDKKNEQNKPCPTV